MIDSYLGYNLVTPNIIYKNEKIWRPLPDPLDINFVLGNDNALPLLEAEIDRYKYATNLNALRYLVDAYDSSFWNASFYNCWLQAIRELNPAEQPQQFPLFMQTVAWQQQKINTQLAAWAQLRHDNLLYAKQPYTFAAPCSYPHSYLEPYPAFYQQISNLASTAISVFRQFPGNSVIQRMINYFQNMENVMNKLEGLAHKELNRQPFSQDEITFLKQMLFVPEEPCSPEFSGWIAGLFYELTLASMKDFVIADVHTQPTDNFGNIVGRVLHVGVGKVNLGIFLAEAPAASYQPMAFVGPVLSYYEKITEDFDRLTDQRWSEMVDRQTVPPRPDWVNIYLADSEGQALPPGRELPGNPPQGTHVKSLNGSPEFRVLPNFPNPFNPLTIISYTLPESRQVSVAIYDVSGRLLRRLVNQEQPAGRHQVTWQAEGISSGVYLCRIQAGREEKVIKLMLLK